MSGYTIPTDVETEDKILGPFGFRQFVYLLICLVLGAAAYGLFLIAPVLVVLPVPVIVFFLIIALPLKKEQPMETYVAALIRFYFRPQKRLWVNDGQESFVTLEEAELEKEPELKSFDGVEASKRITFLSDIIDSHGWATRGVTAAPGTSLAVNVDIENEAKKAVDIFDTQFNATIGSELAANQLDYHSTLLAQMQQAEHNAQPPIIETEKRDIIEAGN